VRWRVNVRGYRVAAGKLCDEFQRRAIVVALNA
jgi:hypothetical protein